MTEEEYLEDRCYGMLMDCLIEGVIDGKLTKDSSLRDLRKFVKKFMYAHNLSLEKPDE